MSTRGPCNGGDSPLSGRFLLMVAIHRSRRFLCAHPHTDGRRIVYHAGADLYVHDPTTDKNWKIEVDYHSPRTQRSRKFVESAKYLEDYVLHPQGHLLAVTTRGKVFTMGNWEGPTVQHGEPDGVRHRVARSRGK